MKSSLYLTITLLALISVTTLVEAQQQRRGNRSRRAPRSALQKGDQAPEFKLYALSKAGEPSQVPLTVKEVVAERPATLIFSSFT